jgi:predicted small secreted protein
MIKRLLLAAMATVLLLVASVGCHTARGFGEDMERTGEKIQDKADEHR